MTAARVLPLAAVLGLCAVLLNPAGALTEPVAHKDERTITAETPGILDIEGGECFTDPTYHRSAAEEIVLYVPCAEGAENQSYGFVHVPDGPWDPARLTEFAWERCRADFASRWPSAGSELDFYPIMPTRETWADGDRDVMCAVYNPLGELPGSALPLAR